MDEYVPEAESLSAALLAEVANGLARDLRAARAELDTARARMAALEAVAEAARAALDVDPTSRAGAEAHIRLEAALDAVPAAGTASGERDLQFHCTHSTHEVAPLRCGGRHYGLPCGPGCAPVVP
jgi:hypothetical protein